MIKRMENMPQRNPRTVPILIGLILVIIAGIGGYELGIRQPQTFEIKGIANADGTVVPAADFAIFWDAWRTIQSSYLRAGEVTSEDMIHGAAEGLVGALKDPYSVFMNPSDAKRFSEDINGNFGGIGAEIGMKNDQIVVIAPLKNSPAEKSGILAGDKILEINASSTMNMNISEAVKIIRGPKGTTVSFTIGRSGHDKPLTIKVVRDTIKIPIIEWEMKEKNIAHIQFFTFSENSALLM